MHTCTVADVESLYILRVARSTVVMRLTRSLELLGHTVSTSKEDSRSGKEFLWIAGG